jgi:hypothetical protein
MAWDRKPERKVLMGRNTPPLIKLRFFAAMANGAHLTNRMGLSRTGQPRFKRCQLLDYARANARGHVQHPIK